MHFLPSLLRLNVQSRLGSPEGELSLAQAVIYLAVAPKSNAVYKALAKAKQMANEHGGEPVPLHLRNAPTQLMKSLDYGAEYKYAHDYDESYVVGENYLPEAIKDEVLYIQAGGGWVADSQPSLEWKESLNKGRAIFRARMHVGC